MSPRSATHDLVVVANRLPVQRPATDAPWETSPGGLVRALLGTVRSSGGAWVGWGGSVEDAPSPFEHEGDHLDRTETPEGFIVFTPPRMRKPLTLGLEVRGFLTKLRINALWNGCAFVI